MTIIRKIAYNTIFAAGARIIAVALSLVSLGFITRYLGKEGFGNYSLILAFLFIFNILADLGLYSLMTREISRPGADERKIASNIFTIRIFALLLFLGLAIVLIWFFPYTSQVKLGVVIGSVGYLFLSASQVLMGIFQKYLRIDKAGLADIISRLIQLVLVIIFIHFNLGFFSILTALIISCIGGFILNWAFARKHIPVTLAFDFDLWKKLIKIAIPIAASIVLTLIYFKFDTIFLSLGFINRSSANPVVDVGIYNVAYRILEGLIFFPSMFVGLIMPLLSKFAFSNPDEFRNTFQKTLDILIIFIIPLVAGLLILSLPLVILIGGEQFEASAPVLRLLSFAIGLIFLGNLFGHSIIALNKQKSGAWIYFSGMIFNIITNLIFIPRYSYLGAASTTVATELLVTILMIYLIYKTINYFPRFNIIKPLIAVMFMVGFLYLFRGWNLFLLIGGGIIIYFVVLYLIKGIRKEELLLLTQKEA
jgi:O-antigen/teichoic acid export membrane protein